MQNKDTWNKIANFLSVALWVIFDQEGNIMVVTYVYIMDHYMTQENRCGFRCRARTLPAPDWPDHTSPPGDRDGDRATEICPAAGREDAGGQRESSQAESQGTRRDGTEEM